MRDVVETAGGSAESSGVLTTRTANLPAAFTAAASARALVTEALTVTERQGWADAATLAVSEIVTNAILHAHSAIEVHVEVSVDLVRVEVRDFSPSLPVRRRYGPQATTGRGLALVAAVTRASGVRPLGGDGKVVWFTVGDAPEDRSEADLLAAFDQDVMAGEPGDIEAVVTATSPPAEPVVLLAGMPVALWRAAREHHDALLREFALRQSADPDDATPAGGAAGGASLAAADAARRAVSDAVDAADAARDVPRADAVEGVVGVRGAMRDASALDVPLHPPAGAAAAYATLADTLDAAERLAAAGALLSPPGLPEIVAVRDWVCGQVLSQLDGAPPVRWPGSGTPSGEGARRPAPEWDTGPVRDAAAAMVAADDANRILAVSRPLAQLLGWAVDDLVGSRLVAIVPPRLRELHVAGFTRHLATRRAHILGQTVELPVLRADGTELVCRLVIEHVAVPPGRSVYVARVEPAG